MSRLKLAASALALAGLVFGSVAFAQVQRTFVASYGSDANTATNCGFTNPCRGFTAALSKTNDNGEIIALDAAGYGAVTIDKSVSIIANPGSYAGISASSGNAITINTAGVKVLLRGLNVNGIGASNGVYLTAGASLTIQNSVFTNFTYGINVGVASGAPTVDVRISDTVIMGSVLDGILLGGPVRADVYRVKSIGNGQSGIFACSCTATSTTIAAISDSDFSNNAYGVVGGVVAAAGTVIQMTVMRSSISNNSAIGVWNNAGATSSTITVGYGSITGNGTGFMNSSGTLETMNNNMLRQNTTATTGTITGITGG